MLLLLQFSKGKSADYMFVDNVVEYSSIDDEGTYIITYENPNDNYNLFDVTVKHVINVKEVKN